MRRGSSHRRLIGLWGEEAQALAYRDRRFSGSRRWRWTDRREREILSGFLSSIVQGASGLDIPCGAGRMGPHFQMAGLGWLGADASIAMARLARKSLGSPTLVADAMALPFPEDTFSFVVCVRLLHRLPDPEERVRILRELGRVCHGPALVTYYTRWNLRGIQRWLKGKHPGLSLARIRKDAREAGLRIQRAIPLRRLTQQEWFFVLKREGGPGPKRKTTGSS